MADPHEHTRCDSFSQSSAGFSNTNTESVAACNCHIGEEIVEDELFAKQDSRSTPRRGHRLKDVCGIGETEAN